MSKITTVYTPDEIREYATRDFVISAELQPNFQLITNSQGSYDTFYDNSVNVTLRQNNPMAGGDHTAEIARLSSVNISRYENDNNRKIGVITGVLDDGSFTVTILGNGQIKRSTKKYTATQLAIRNLYHLKYINVSHDYFVDVSEQTTVWGTDHYNLVYKENRLSARFPYGRGNFAPVSSAEATLFEPVWQTPTTGFALETFLNQFAKLGNDTVSNSMSDIQLTNNMNTSLKIGDPFTQYYFYPSNSDYLLNGYKNIGGDLYSFLSDACVDYDAFASTLHFHSDDGSFPTLYPQLVTEEQGTYCAHWIPFNLILTRDEGQARHYLETGELPSDAFIYPYDVDDIPTNDSGEDPGDVADDPEDPGDGDTPDEDGTPDDNCQPMPTDVPDSTPQSLTNNNLYWLSTLGLKNFIDWFWTDATDVASVGDLWDKIRGLYENLSQAIISVRYMPVKIEWIGGAGSENAIIVGMIEKTQPVSTIQKTVAPIRQIGYIDVQAIANGSWINYTPYSSISLYLPFHGMVQLDNDFIMKHKLFVEVVYDIMSGTIQYFIHRDSYNGSLVYSTICKMSVEIPISLQTKTERDTAVMQNVSSLTAGLIGAGASAVTGSPIGVTMGLTSLAGFQPSSAGIHVLGNVGESGSFYAPKQCALYIKRPSYNRPNIYKSRVGYPANQTKKLSSCSGFTTCYKPRISFSGNHISGGSGQSAYDVTIKPTKHEIELIYEYLEKGVIL